MSRGDIKAGSAYVELLLRNNKFVSGLKSSIGMLYGFAKGAAVVGTAVAAAGAAVAAGGLSKFLDLSGTLQDMSDRTGVSAQSLSELKHAAEQSGGSLADVEGALRAMTRKGLDPKQFDAIAAGIGAIEDPAERARKATEVFGRGGAKLLPMLGSLQELRQEARDMGLTMSNEAAAAGDNLGDSLATLWKTVSFGAVAIGQAVAPFVSWALPTVQQFATGALLAIQSAGAYIQENVGVLTGYVSSAWQATVDYVMPIVSALGTVISEVFTMLWGVAQEVWGGILGIITSVWGGVQESTGGVMQWLQDTIIGVFSSISFAIQNWKTLALIALTSAELGVVRFANRVVYFFGTVMPAWLSWFGEHWHEVFIDMGNLVATVAGNIWENLKNLWEAVKGLFNGEGFEFDFTPLTEGFESAITELPKIAEREMGPLEKSLQDDLDGLAGTAAKAWEDHSKKFATRVKKFTPTSPELEAVMGRQASAAGGEAAAIEGIVPNTGKAKGEIFGAFSAAALQAQGGAADPVVKAIEKQDKKEEKRHSELVAAIREGGVLS